MTFRGINYLFYFLGMPTDTDSFRRTLEQTRDWTTRVV